MYKDKVCEFYKNKIDDVKDEEVKEKLLERLEAIEDDLFLLEMDIDEEVENQEDVFEFQEDGVLADEFNYANRMPM